MKKSKFLISGLFCLYLAIIGCGRRGEISLENPSVRFAIKNGSVVTLYDKTRSLEHVNLVEGDTLPGIFKLKLKKEDGGYETLSAEEMEISMEEATRKKAVISFSHDLCVVTISFRIEDSIPEIQSSIAVVLKDKSLGIAEAGFPVLKTSKVNKGEKKEYLRPGSEGYLRYVSQTNWGAYPTELFSQFMGCLSGTGGFVLWTDDTKGHVKAFGYDADKENALFYVRNLIPGIRGEDWNCSYNTRISLCGSEWQDAADVYKAWVVNQEWCKTLLKDRTDIAEVAKTSFLGIHSEIDREDLRTLPDRLESWKKGVNAKIIYRPLGWEKYGRWAGIDYFPVRIGDEKFINLIKELKKREIDIVAFPESFHWVRGSTARTDKENQEMEDYFINNKGNDLCVMMENGEVFHQDSEGRDDYFLCRGTEYGSNFLQSLAGKLFDYGIPMVHIDYDHIGRSYLGGLSACYNPNHDHKYPYGTWFMDYTKKAFRDIREMAKERGIENFTLSLEWCKEMLIPELNFYQARFFYENRAVVPLSQYLFHEYVPVSFGWIGQNPNVKELGRLLIHAQTPCFAFWGNPKNPGMGYFTLNEDSRILLNDYFEAYNGYANPYLIYGKMLRPMINDKYEQIAELENGSGREKRSVLLQTAWEYHDGSIGIFAINTDMTQEISGEVTVPEGGDWVVVSYAGNIPDGDGKTLKAGSVYKWDLPSGRLCGVVLKKHTN